MILALFQYRSNFLNDSTKYYLEFTLLFRLLWLSNKICILKSYKSILMHEFFVEPARWCKYEEKKYIPSTKFFDSTHEQTSLCKVYYNVGQKSKIKSIKSDKIAGNQPMMQYFSLPPLYSNIMSKQVILTK